MNNIVVFVFKNVKPEIQYQMCMTHSYSYEYTFKKFEHVQIHQMYIIIFFIEIYQTLLFFNCRQYNSYIYVIIIVTSALKYCLFLNIFGEEESLGINGRGEYNQQFDGFKVWMDSILKFVRSKYYRVPTTQGKPGKISQIW